MRPNPFKENEFLDNTYGDETRTNDLGRAAFTV